MHHTLLLECKKLTFFSPKTVALEMVVQATERTISRATDLGLDTLECTMQINDKWQLLALTTLLYPHDKRTYHVRDDWSDTIWLMNSMGKGPCLLIFWLDSNDLVLEMSELCNSHIVFYYLGYWNVEPDYYIMMNMVKYSKGSKQLSVHGVIFNISNQHLRVTVYCTFKTQMVYINGLIILETST